MEKIGYLENYEVVGEIKAELTGAAKLASDGRYEIRKTIDKEIMSCWVPTRAFKNSVKTASLEMTSNGKPCNNYFLPRGLRGNNQFSVNLDSHACLITRD